MSHFTDDATATAHTSDTRPLSAAEGWERMMSQSDDEPALTSRPPMPRVLDFRTPEEFSEALRVSGFLSETTEGALTDTEGLLRRAVYAPDGQLEFVDRSHSLSTLYGEDRVLRSDAKQILAAQDSIRDANYNDGLPE